jgi:hypothetical protein
MKRGRAESTVKNKRKGKTENTEEPPRCLVQMTGKKIETNHGPAQILQHRAS